MGDAEYTFAQARARLEDIVGQVRKKDMSLETSLDLLEEGVRLANTCTEQIDQSEWRTVAEETNDVVECAAAASDSAAGVEPANRSTDRPADDAAPAGEALEALADGSEDSAGDGVQELAQQ